MPRVIARDIPEDLTAWPECSESETPCYADQDDDETNWSCTRIEGHDGPHAGHYFDGNTNMVGIAWADERTMDKEKSVDKNEEVNAFVDKAEVLMSILGEPDRNNRQEMLLTAQTLAMLALVKSMNPQPEEVLPERTNATGSLFTRPPHGTSAYNGSGDYASVKRYITAMTQDYQVSEALLKSVMRDVIRVVPEWENRKIQAIKELRSITNLGLKESKDFIDFAATTAHYAWWL